MKKIILIIACLAGLGFLFYVYLQKEPNIIVFDFDGCVTAGYPVLESYPAQCKTPDGRSFYQDIGNELEKIDLIKVDDPRPNQVIQSPIIITGQARGYWFFEASFPIKLYDDKSNLLAGAIAEAQKEWMTEDFVPFKVEMNFDMPQDSKRGLLVFEKDNPSGLPEHDDQLVMPIVFK